MRVQRRTAASTAALALTGLIATSIAAAPAQAGNPNSARKLADAVTTQGVMRHLEALQGIADANDSSSARPVTARSVSTSTSSTRRSTRPASPRSHQAAGRSRTTR